MLSLLLVFNVDGRTKIAKGNKETIAASLEKLQITRSSIEITEENLLDELRKHGKEDDFEMDKSFATESSFVSNASSFDKECEHETTLFFQSKISAIKDTDNNIDDADADSENTEELLQSLRETSSDRVVSFNDSPMGPTIPTAAIAPKLTSSRNQKNQPLPPVPLSKGTTLVPSLQPQINPRRSQQRRVRTDKLR